MKKFVIVILSAVLTAGVTLNAQDAPSVAASSEQAGEVPVTTSSPAARKAFEEGVALRENLHLDESVQKWREATKLDPNFSQAWAYLAWVTRDPKEAKLARDKAKASMGKASPGEQLLVKWMTSRDEGDFVTAISSMNDLLAMYPKDKRVAFQAARWLFFQDQFEQSAKMAERALAIDPDYLTALNSGAYAYASLREFDKAITNLQRYSKLAPKEPNPHDSLGEILRLAGRYPESLEEYNKALAIDPKFVSAIRGIGDTYSLMGEQAKARDEYAKAMPIAETKKDKLDYEIQSAITYLRENDKASAEKAFTAIAKEAHQLGFAEYEAMAHRDIALFSEPKAAMKHLSEAEAALNEKHEVSKTDHDEQLARTLQVEVMTALAAKDQAAAKAAYAKLQKLAEGNRNQIVQGSMHIANGELLAAAGKTDDAVSELQEDPANVFGQKLLVSLYEKKGDTADAQSVRQRLAGDHEVYIEDGLVSPEFRKESAKG